ncbi:MAG: hypothetical protein WBA74_25405, partial [Cyclobacteriaceae bacterium]
MKTVFILITSIAFVYTHDVTVQQKAIIKQSLNKVIQNLENSLLANNQLEVVFQNPNLPDYPYLHAKSLFTKGYLQEELDQDNEALVSYLSAIHILKNSHEQEKNKSLKVDILFNLGDLYRNFHNYDRAIESYSIAIQVAKVQKDARQLSRLYYNRAFVHHDSKAYSQANTYLDSALISSDH